MFVPTYYCDGCGLKLSTVEVQNSVEKGVKFSQENPGMLYQGRLFDHDLGFKTVTEVLCTTCLVSSDDYWSNKLSLLKELVEQMNKRYERNRRSFFESRRGEIRKVEGKK